MKDNQPKLREAIEKALGHRQPKTYINPAIQFHSTTEKNRDRFEVRRCWVTDSLTHLPMKDDWVALQQIAMVECERTLKVNTSIERRFYISSSSLSVSIILDATRSHWGIENELHWVLDMAFREDESRVRKGHSAENLSRLRQIALNLLKQDKTKKIGIKNKRLRAGWDEDYLLHLLNIDYLA